MKLRALTITRTALLALCLMALNGTHVAAGEKIPLETAVFAGGCFWCVESDFDAVPGVTETISGFTGGHVDNPSYKQVTRGGTGHIESVSITFDPALVSYEHLVHLFWRSVDPTDAGGQFCDRGPGYATAIFAASQRQHDEATASKTALEQSGLLKQTIATPIRMLTTFWPAEKYHQNYGNKNPLRYKYYRNRCGRDKRVKALWGDEDWTRK